jgi:antirestriction protein ArdC
MPTTTKTRTDIYAQVTDRIVAELEKGVRPWLKPWNAEHAAGRIRRPLRHNGTPYQGINILMLWASAEMAGFHCPYWLTFQQAKQLGGFVKKGEHGSPVVYASTFKKSDTTDDGAEVESEIPFLKQYTVFNACQIEGLPEHFFQLAEQPRHDMQRIEQAEAFFVNTKADIRTGGSRAYYTITDDYVQLPPFECFRDAESHAATAAHELCHWTRHPSRLDRDLGRKRWGDAGYAMEELVAELGSAFLCADLAITPELRDDHASYLACWLEVLKNDKRAIFSAASLASKAVDYLHGLQPAAS